MDARSELANKLRCRVKNRSRGKFRPPPVLPRWAACALGWTCVGGPRRRPLARAAPESPTLSAHPSCTYFAQPPTAVQTAGTPCMTSQTGLVFDSKDTWFTIRDSCLSNGLTSATPWTSGPPGRPVWGPGRESWRPARSSIRPQAARSRARCRCTAGSCRRELVLRPASRSPRTSRTTAASAACAQPRDSVDPRTGLSARHRWMPLGLGLR